MMQKTALHEHHLFFEAKMVTFAGYEMPLYYRSIEDEHAAVRTNAGYFDVSHMGELKIEGEGATALMDKIFSNTLPTIGQARYGIIMNENGFPVDDVLVYKFAEEKYWIVCNASNTYTVKNHVREYVTEYRLNKAPVQIFSGEIEDITERISLVALQGPNAQAMLQTILDDALAIKRFHFQELPFKNHTIIVSRTGYTGEDGFEIYGPHDAILRLWEQFAETSALPCGLGARDTLRFEAGYPLFGEELIPVLTPLSSHLDAFIDWSKKDTVGIAALVKQKDEGIKHFLTGLELQDKGIARSGYGVYVGEERIGEITTGYKLRHFSHAKALAFIQVPHHKIGTEVMVEIRDHHVKAKVIAYPFYQKLKKKKVSK